MMSLSSLTVDRTLDLFPLARHRRQDENLLSLLMRFVVLSSLSELFEPLGHQQVTLKALLLAFLFLFSRES